MSTQSEIAATREEISAVRDRMSDTVAAIEAQVSERVDSVKERLDVMQVVRDHPWPALAVALGAGIAIAATGADRKAASATADASRSAAKASADAAKASADAVKSGVRAVKSKVQGGETDTSQPADHSPSRTHGMIVGALDSLAAKLATSLIERLREPEPLRATPEPEGLGYTDNTTPAQGVDSPSA